MRPATVAGLALLLASPFATPAADVPPIARGVRGLATRAPGSVAVDGKLTEWADAFVTPVHYAHANPDDRAAQILAIWDDRALYIGLRALDRHRANVGAKGSLWNGDAVEFYLDTRPGAALRGKDWSAGAIHLFYTPFENAEVKPRWEMRGGIVTSGVVLSGVELAATAHEWGDEVEFAIPWANFPGFAPKAGSDLAMDAELCSGDGGGRTDRTFAYGSPLSVQQPASQGMIELVESFDPAGLPPAVAASTFPMWVETPWVQPDRAKCRAVVAIAPGSISEVAAVAIRLHDADGADPPDTAAPSPASALRGSASRAVAEWSIDDFAPGTYFATARITSKTGKVLATVAPRMVQERRCRGDEEVGGLHPPYVSPSRWKAPLSVATRTSSPSKSTTLIPPLAWQSARARSIGRPSQSARQARLTTLWETIAIRPPGCARPVRRRPARLDAGRPGTIPPRDTGRCRAGPGSPRTDRGRGARASSHVSPSQRPTSASMRSAAATGSRPCGRPTHRAVSIARTSGLA